MTTYTTTQGDTWDHIALKTMRSESYTGLLLEANADKQDIFVFSAGEVLTVPDVPESAVTADNLPPWKGGNG